MKSKLVAIQSPREGVVRITVKLVPSIRCCRYVDHTVARPKRYAYEIHSLGRGTLWGLGKTGKETSLEDNEKEPEGSWDSVGGDML